MSKRFKTDYPGVSYFEANIPGTKKKERVYYIRYYRDGKRVEEKCGRQYTDNWTAAQANTERSLRIAGKKKSNQDRRDEKQAEKTAEQNRYTIEKLFETYKETNPNRKDTINDQNRFDNYIGPEFGKKEPQDLYPLDIQRLKINLLKTKAPATVRNILELLRRIINFGAKSQLCPGLSFTIEMPEVDNEKTEDLTETQLAALFSAIERDDHPQAGPVMLTALYTGMRRGELFRLKWSDIDFERGFITLRDPKGKKDQKIPLNDPAKDLLEDHPRTESKFVFPGRGGRERTDIKKAVNEIKEKAKLPSDFRPLHGLRHVYASGLASSGQVDLFTLQKLLTHKSPAMTTRYAHLRDDALRRASDLAGNLFTPPKKDIGVKKIIPL